MHPDLSKAEEAWVNSGYFSWGIESCVDGVVVLVHVSVARVIAGLRKRVLLKEGKRLISKYFEDTYA